MTERHVPPTRDLLALEKSLWMSGVELIAGVDEAGRGPLAGPVVAAAVVFPRGIWIDGVDDSKKLSERQRTALFPLIHARALAVSVKAVSHSVIDSINILQASILAMQQAVDTLSCRPDVILADGNSFRHAELPFRNVIRGDSKSLSIAAASIVAKVTRDHLMRSYDAHFPVYGFARHKGYPTPQHLEAIRSHGPCEIHRRSFRMPVPDSGLDEPHAKGRVGGRVG